MGDGNSGGIRITLVGAGTIGLSFAALHLAHLQSPLNLTIYDIRPDLSEYIDENLSKYLPESIKTHVASVRRCKDLATAVANANIVQESGPENVAFKSTLWPQIERHAPEDALFWSSTSGIPASAQSIHMKDPSRLLVVHPYNPPHVMPLLEIIPSPKTSFSILEATLAFWRECGRNPVVIKKECTGFVANRLAFALLRECVHLVAEGVVGVEDLDRIVETSMGPRWAVAGPFRSYHAGGGPGGLEGFFSNIGTTIQACWDEAGQVKIGGQWEQEIFSQAEKAYGIVNIEERDRITKRVLEVIAEERARKTCQGK